GKRRRPANADTTVAAGARRRYHPAITRPVGRRGRNAGHEPPPAQLPDHACSTPCPGADHRLCPWNRRGECHPLRARSRPDCRLARVL
ncbi:MAG: hypothetical protein AVDCRST_MAG43-826, partial [uncultured Thermomicrobiales bacterium]